MKQVRLIAKTSSVLKPTIRDMEKLDQYFDKGRLAKEIVSLSEIDDVLSSHHQRVKRQPVYSYDLFQRKGFRFASLTIFAIVIGSIVVLLIQDKTHDQEVYIPQKQRRIMHLVNNISDRPHNREISVSQFGSPRHPVATGIPIHLRSKFELSEDKLKLIGIRYYDDYIQYEGNVEGGYVSFALFKIGSIPPANVHPLEVSDGQRTGVKNYEFYPWFMTDEAGYQGFRYRLAKEPALKMTSSFFLNSIDELIPIQVNRPGFKKAIFWFSQTPELMNILESAAMIPKNTDVSDHSRTDRTSETIEIEIFPTITKGEVQVITKVIEEQKLEITLLNSSGEVLQMPVSNQVLTEGDHKFTIDLSTLRKGLYFLRIKSDPGLITIHRLFKE